MAGVIESQAPDKWVYEPGNPLADAKGYVKMPSVDVVGEMVNTMSASRSYQANVEVLNTVKTKKCQFVFTNTYAFRLYIVCPGVQCG